MERSVLFFTLSLVCFYLILDEFVGKKRISLVLENGFGNTTAPAPAPVPNPKPAPFDPDKTVPDAPNTLPARSGGIT